MNVNSVNYQSLFNELNVSSNFTNVDNLVVNDSLNFTTAMLTGPTSNWSSLQNALNTLTNGVTTLQTRATTDEANINSNTSAITALQSRATTDEANISSNTSAITALQSRLTTDEATLSSVQTTANGALQTNGSNYMTAALLLANGTVGAPGLALESDATTGLYSVSSGILGVATSGTNRLKIGSAGLTTTIDILPSTNITQNLGTTSISFNNICGYLLAMQLKTYLVTSADCSTANMIQLGTSAYGISEVPGGTGYLCPTSFAHIFYINGVSSLNISGSSLTSTVPHLSATGSVTAPTYAFSGNSNTGIYSSASNNIDFATNGVNRLNITTVGATYSVPVFVTTGSAGAPSYAFAESSTGIYWIGTGSLGITTSGTLRLTIASTAITSTIPYLAPAGSVSAPSITFAGNTNTGMYSTATNNIDFATNGVRCMNMNTTNVQHMIDIVPSANSTRSLGSSSLCYSNIYTDLINYSNNAVGSSTTTPNKINLWSGTYGISILASTMGFLSPASSFFNFYCGGTRYFQISTTAITSPSQFLGPDGTANTPTYSFSSTPTVGMYYGSSGVTLQDGGTAFLSVALNFIQISANLKAVADNTYTCGMSANRFSAVYAVNGTIQTSDARMKNSINDLDLGLSFINKLRPVSFKWNPEDHTDKETKKTTTVTHKRTHAGLIAQEVKQAIEDEGKTLNDVDIIDNDFLCDNTQADRYGIRYHTLIPILIKAVNELTARVQYLEEQLKRH